MERLFFAGLREGLVAADIFLQVHENFADFAVNHPDASRRKFARQQFLKSLDYAAAAGSNHITILPGVKFAEESREKSLARAADELSWRVERASEMKLTVAVEPHVGSIMDTPSVPCNWRCSCRASAYAGLRSFHARGNFRCSDRAAHRPRDPLSCALRPQRPFAKQFQRKHH